MKWWPSTHRPAITPPWNPRQATPCPPTPSNPRKYRTQIRRGWAWGAIFLGVYQGQEWWKPKGPRNVRIIAANRKPHTAQRWRRIVTRHHGEVNVSIIPWIDEGMTLTIWVATPFLLLEAIQFGERSLFTHNFGKRIIGGDFFPLMMGRTFIFRRRHDRLFEWGRWVVRFWGRWHDEEKGIKKAF